MRIHLSHLSLSFCIYASCFLSKVSANDSISASESLKDGETLISNGANFELGFFSPGSSTDRYLGIWYKNIPIRTIVWVANRQNAVKDSSGSLTINRTGSLVLSNGTDVFWSSSVPARPAQDSFIQLLDSGNLVVRDNRNENADIYLWQSFDYPTDTLLPGMKLGWDLRTSLNRRLSSWKSITDPSPGELSLGIELDPYPQAVMLRGTRKFFRGPGGPWNTGAPELMDNPVFGSTFVSNQNEVYFTYHLLNTSVISRIVLNQTGTRQRYVWVEADQSWRTYATVPRDYCDTYGLCGGNGRCSINDSPVCQCLKGFKPRSPQSWNAIDWSNGCGRDESFECSGNNDFVKFSGLKLPDTVNSWVNDSMNLRQCREECSKNCSCMAYANSDISGRAIGCLLWFGDLVDIRQFSDGGQNLYIRMPASKAKRSLVIVAIVVPIGLICGLLVLIYDLRRRKMKAKGENEDGDEEKEDMDLPFLELAKVARATDNFSFNKKLGEGGFGPVYQGTLMDGQNIAVKRLSNSSEQGVIEFKNEVKLIAKLQHRNLVKLLACCIEEEEKILIYEYMPNGSLDSFLFDKARSSQLDWSKRFNIICGIARGLVYLHQDSRLRIIHRDLKASNVLLDDDLNPKISDFGLARTFGGDQSEENTKRIVGTYGYMAPEYAVYGLFSVKSDVFSFGILLLEIVSGKKNRGHNHEHNHHNLIGYAWKLWTEKKPLELIDSILDDLLIQSEMIRCIHVGLLCIQQNPEDRPNMPTALLMLIGEKMLLQPKQPGLLIDFILTETSSSSSKNNTCSVNDLTITTMEAR